ncbi:MAG: hypothetical protein AAF493_28990 [Pseudomonadota bacterium]
MTIKDIDFDLDDINPPPLPSTMSEADTARRSRGISLASAMRWLGGGLLGFAALLYMLQGFGDIDAGLRNWATIGLMGLLGAGGALSLYLMHDRKGARLFFALGTALLPVHFSQLGGLVHELFGGVGTGLATLLDYSGVSLASVGTMTTASIALFIPVAFVGFSILARSHAKVLTGVYAVLVATILFPARESWLAVGIIASMAGVFAAMEWRLFRQQPLFSTAEGIAVRVIFLSPVLITLGRSLFYADDGTALAAGLAALGATFAAVLPGWFQNTLIRHALRTLGILTLATAWAVYSIGTLLWATSGFDFALTALPLAALFIGASYLSENGGRAYRAIGSTIGTGVIVLAMLDQFGYAEGLLGAAIGATYLGLAIVHRERYVLTQGIGLLAAATIGIAVLTIGTVEINAWIGLAGAGVAVVVLSSVVERYGRSLLNGLGKQTKLLREWS